MPWGVAAAAITAGAGLIGSAAQSSAVSGAQDSANAAQQAALAQTREDLEPWRKTGGNALMLAGDVSGANGVDAARAAQGQFLESPGYQWQLGEGLRAIGAKQSAAGLFNSGATQKAQMGYAEGLAKQDFGNWYNRLFSLSQQGLSAAGGTANAEMQTGQGIAQTDMSAGQQQASIYGDAASGIGTALGGALSNPKVQNSLFGVGGGTVGNAYSPSIYGVPSPY